LLRRTRTSLLLCVLCLLLISSSVSAADVSETAKLIHAEAWLEVAEKAQIDPAYKYAIYMSRTLAVKHPELYLQGDALFNQMLRSEDNMGRYYQNRTQDLYQQMEEYKANGRKTV